MNNLTERTGGRPPVNENGLTEKQQAFCDIYLATGNSHEAVRMAGYECKDQNIVRMMAYQNLKNEACKKYIDAGKSDIRTHFKDECYAAFQTIVNLMQSKNVSARTRLDAAKDILDRAGYNPTTKIEGGVSFDNRLQEVAERARALAIAEPYLDADIVDTGACDAHPAGTCDPSPLTADKVIQPDSPPLSTVDNTKCQKTPGQHF